MLGDKPVSLFREKGRHIQGEIIEETDNGSTLKIVFTGDHHGSNDTLYGPVKEAIQKTNPVAVILNFLEYRYGAGNEMGGVFIFSHSHASEPGKGRPIAVITKGATARNLQSLFDVFMLRDTGLDCEFFESVEAGSDWLRKVLSETK
jgi:hypothetical protein